MAIQSLSSYPPPSDAGPPVWLYNQAYPSIVRKEIGYNETHNLSLHISESPPLHQTQLFRTYLFPAEYFVYRQQNQATTSVSTVSSLWSHPAIIAAPYSDCR